MDPRALILGDAPSGVDTQTERDIRAAQERLLRDRTSFVVAERLPTITKADRIVVLDRGRIVETARHAKLLERRGRCFELYSMTFAERLA